MGWGVGDGKKPITGGTTMSNEPYKEEINSLLGLVRLALIIMAGVAGVGLGATELGIMP